MSVFQPGNVAYGFSQSLLGVPNLPIIAQRNPTSDDKAVVGSIWINSALNDAYIETSIVDNVATWITINGSVAITAIVTNSGTAVPSGGVINLLGGANIITSASGNTVDVAVTPNIDLPATNAAGTQGIYQIGGFNFLFAYPQSSTFVGTNAGNTTSNPLLALNNVAVGKSALSAVTTGNSNTAVGQAALAANTTGLNNVAVGNLAMSTVTTGDTNIAIGNQALESLITGNDNLAIGFAAGSAYIAAESSNILIGHSGVTGDLNVIRIGSQGTGAGQQDAIYVAGIYNAAVGATNQVVLVDNTGALGSSKGTNGQVLIGSTAGSPEWETLTAGAGIAITNAANSITVASTITQGIVTIDGNTGSVTGTTVTVEGGNNINSSGSGTTLTVNVSGTTQHAVQIGNATGSLTSLGVGTTGQVLIGSTAADPVFGALGVNSGLTAHGVLLGENNSAIIATAVGTTGQVLIGATGADPSFGAIGTNSGLTAHSILLAEGNSAFTALGAATNGQLPIGSTGADPVLATITAGSGISVTNGAGSITVANTQTQGIVTIDGNSGSVTGTTVTIEGGNNITSSGAGSTLTVGVSGTTQHSLLLGNATGSINSLGVATNGEIAIGSTGADPVLATITAGTGISVTNGAGSITIAATGSGEIATLDGDTGSATGTTVTLAGGNNITTAASGATVTFNVSGTTNHAVQVGNATNSLTSLSVGTTGQVLIGSTGANPAFGSLGVNSGLTAHGVLLGENNSAIVATTAGSTGQVLIGSTGADPAFGALGVNSGLTAHSLILAEGNSAFTALGAATNGQLPIGSTGADPVLATITAGSGITVTNGAGSITIASSGGGGGITTLDGNTGSATGSTVTFDATTQCGSSVYFGGAGATMSLYVTDGYQNVLIGEGTGNNTGTGGGNTCIGRSSFINFTTAASNAALGIDTLLTVSSSSYNVAIGDSALTALDTGSGLNTALGYQSLNGLVTGTGNIAVGANSGTDYSGSESNNILIGNVGTFGESDVIRLGDGTQTTCYIAGIAGVAVSSSAAVLINTSTGQLGTVVSSRRYKENIENMDKASNPLLELRPVVFNYKHDLTHERKFGLIAEEVDEIFPDLVIYNKEQDPESVKYHDLPVLLLNELQKQHNLIADLMRRIERLERRGAYEQHSHN